MMRVTSLLGAVVVLGGITAAGCGSGDAPADEPAEREVTGSVHQPLNVAGTVVVNGMRVLAPGAATGASEGIGGLGVACIAEGVCAAIVVVGVVGGILYTEFRAVQEVTAAQRNALMLATTLNIRLSSSWMRRGATSPAIFDPSNLRFLDDHYTMCVAGTVNGGGGNAGIIDCQKTTHAIAMVVQRCESGGGKEACGTYPYVQRHASDIASEKAKTEACQGVGNRDGRWECRADPTAGGSPPGSHEVTAYYQGSGVPSTDEPASWGCTSSRHAPCAGSHTHMLAKMVARGRNGYLCFEVPNSLNKVTRCDGPLTSLSSVPAGLATTTCGPGNIGEGRASGYWKKTTPINCGPYLGGW